MSSVMVTSWGITYDSLKATNKRGERIQRFDPPAEVVYQMLHQRSWPVKAASEAVN